MAFDIGSVIAKIDADVTGFKNGMRQVNEMVDDSKGRIQAFGDKMGQFGKSMAVAGAAASVAAIPITLFFKSASEEAMNLEKNLTTLDIIAGRFGVSGEKAKEAAQGLGKELRIGVGASANGLQNLLKAGLNLDQATDLMKRFTNEAITGKSSSISLSQAVENLTFAYATNNSAIGNLSGVNENFINIIENGRKALIKEGVAAEKITEEMAKYRGMIDLTNLTMGSSERFHGTLIDKQAELGQKITELKVSLGQLINQYLAPLTDVIINLVNWFNGLSERHKMIIVALGAIAIAVGPVLIILGMMASGMSALITIFGVLSGVMAAFSWPILLIIAAITALYFAWQTNFLGIQEVTMGVINSLMAVWNTVFLPMIQFIALWITNHWTQIKLITDSTWKIIIGIFQVTAAILGGITLALLSLLSGNWKQAWETIKSAVSLAWEGIKNIFNGALGFIRGWGGNLVSELVRPFQDAWNAIQNLVNKIKGALDFTKRHSPSILDIVKSGVSKVNNALGELAISGTVNANAAGLAVSNGGAQNSTVVVRIDMGGAIIADSYGANQMAELLGDGIIKRLQNNVRF